MTTVATSSDVQDESSSSQNCSYRIAQTLGEGAFGQVLLVVDKNNPNCAVAMKKITLDKNNAETNKLVRREALIQKYLSKVGHINVIRFIGMRHDEVLNEYNIFLEYANGGELFDKIEPDLGMPVPIAQFYFRQLIAGLEFIHSYGVVHRDIKPENLLLTSSHVLKISDFGMATLFRNNEQERLLDMNCGTLPYAAPELVAGGKYKAEPVDIWSSGVVLFTMLTGELPWEKPERTQLHYNNWVSNTNLDGLPWSKIDISALSLLRIILAEKVDNRATIEKMKRHPWYRDANGGFDLSTPAKRAKLAPLENLDISTQKVSGNESKISDRLISSFSQPTNLEEMLLTQQIDLSQGSSDPWQRLVKRMTRFCVIESRPDAMRRVRMECQHCGYTIKEETACQLLVSTHRMSMMVTAYEVDTEVGQRVMIDFRRSRGDGLQFKRLFVSLRDRMDDIICVRGENWMQKYGLTPLQDSIDPFA